MAQQQTTTGDTVVSNKPGLSTDVNPSYVSKEQYTHARNAIRNSKDGDLGTIGNEPSTTLCFKATYKIIGTITLPDDEVMVFSTDNVNSEIGIGSTKTCDYRIIMSSSCLNFNDKYIVTGVARKDFQRGILATFTDKYNSVKRIELNKLKSTTTCDDIRLFKLIDQPCITAKKGQAGNIPDGMYSVAIAYVVDNQIFSDFYSITNRIPLHNNNKNSLEVKVSGLDKEFTEFSLVVVGTYVDPVTKGATKLAKVVGTYSTKVKTISITDFINDDYDTVKLSTLVVQKRTWEKAGVISSNSNYLVLSDLVSRPEENYQLKAMSIKAEYTVEQVEANYYENDGRDVSYYGDENYDFYIQGVYNTAELTEKYHIPGRLAESNDRQSVSSADVYEYDSDYECNTTDKVERWQVENTAGELIPQTNKFVCNRRVLGTGKLGYHQSTELYPDNPIMFGEWANTPIRHHKMPDECKVPRYSVVEGKTYINIKGIRFKNIPKFDNPDIVGYKITRSDRKGGNGTIIARGLMTNIRSYKDKQTNQEILYSNYPVNNLGPDNYLSSTQTVFKNNRETNFTPLKDYYKDRFTFYSPHTLFEPRYSLGSEVKIECEEIADITGQFEVVYKHPQLKLLNQFAFWAAITIAAIETYVELNGEKNKTTTTTTGDLSGKAKLNLNIAGTAATIPNNPLDVVDFSGGPLGKVPLSGYGVKSSSTSTGKTNTSALAFAGTALKDALDALKKAIKDGGDVSTIQRILTIVKDILKLIATAGATVVLIGVSVMRYADEILNIINNFTSNTDYVYQYNSKAIFNRSICSKSGNKRRRLTEESLYIPSDVVTIDDKTFNNYFREKSVYFQFNKPIKDPTVKDTSNNTMTGFGACETKKTSATGSAFYVTNKAINPNQYGIVGSANPVSMHSCTIMFDEECPILYGGDCIITRFQFQKRMQFFNQNLSGTNYPPGVEYDYRMYRNMAYPRFWLDSSKYDFSNLLNVKVANFAKFNRTTAAKHNLDCKQKTDGKTLSRIDDAYMYTSANCAMDFFVEADYNVDYREKTQQPFYSKKNTNISEIFRQDRLLVQEEFNINRAFSDLYTTEIFAPQQRDDYDPANPIPTEQPNSVIYSLPSFNLQAIDNWQYFLPANYFSFRESDFGKLTSIHKLDQDRLIFLFSKSSPYISMGRDFLELEGSGRKITIGDGGLFAQDPREIMPTDNNYAACSSKYAFSNTHMGRYYPSANQGRIIEYTENLNDISRNGMSYWCKNYMPIKLYEYFRSYPEIENPVSGVGYLTAFDSFNETVYLTKRDFSPKKEYIKDIIWDKVSSTFIYKDLPISLRDKRYFNDISWTLSYSPLDKAFVSWHDWHPDWTYQTDNHFMSVKDNGMYKHNENYDSFCNFYGIDYPFEIEYLSNAGQSIETVRSIEYQLEVYNYKNSGRNRFHNLNQNFDHLIVSNTEQISPLLFMTHGNPNPEENLMYPNKTANNIVGWDIPFFKEENKYRVNMFWDTVKDRGEFSNAEYHLLATDESGYKSVINPLAIDINKPEEQRKKFRHYWNKFRLIKSVSGNNKMIAKLLNVKKLISPR